MKKTSYDLSTIMILLYVLSMFASMESNEFEEGGDSPDKVSRRMESLTNATASVWKVLIRYFGSSTLRAIMLKLLTSGESARTRNGERNVNILFSPFHETSKVESYPLKCRECRPAVTRCLGNVD